MTEQFKTGDAVTAVIRRNGIKTIQGTVFAATSTHVSIDTAEGPFLANIEDVKRAVEPTMSSSLVVNKTGKPIYVDTGDEIVELAPGKDICGDGLVVYSERPPAKVVEPPVEPAVVNELPPPAEKPKRKVIRRTNEEKNLGIPLDQILAYRADPSSWNPAPELPEMSAEYQEMERKMDEEFGRKVIFGTTPAISPKEEHWNETVKAASERALATVHFPSTPASKAFLEGLGEELNPAYFPATAEQAAILEALGIGWSEAGDNYSLFTNFKGIAFEFGLNHVKARSKKSGTEFDGLWDQSIPFADWAKGVVQNFSDVELSGNTGTLEAPAEDELMPRMELDALQPEVYNYDVMGPMPDGYVLARERFNGIRWYVMYFKLLKKLAYLPGTTSVEDNTSQPPAYLTKWRYDMVARYNDVNAMEGFVDDTAAYGTIMHTLIAWYINGSLPSIGSQSWKDQVCMLITLQDGRIPDIYYPLWDRRLRKDLTCWNQFMIERNVKVHMMEYACGSIGLGVAGQIDLVCTMDFNRGRVNAIIDMKSGKKSTGQGNSKATQLGIYKLIFDEVFPDWKYSDTDKSPMGITKFFNWHPSDYNETPNKETGLVTPTFELVNQTDSVDFVEVGLQMQLFRHRTQGLKPGSNARFTIEGDLKPFADNQTLIKGGQRKDTYIEKYNLEVAADD